MRHHLEEPLNVFYVSVGVGSKRPKKKKKERKKFKTGLLGKGGVDRGERALRALTLELSGCCWADGK